MKMDFEKFSEKYQGIRLPAEAQTSIRTETNEAMGLLEIVKKEDAKSKKQSKRFFLVTAIATVVYIFIFIVNPDPELSINTRLAGSCFIVAFLILAVLFREKHNRLKKSLYLVSLKEFLEGAKKRFQFWNPKQLWLIAVVLLVDVAGMFSISKYFDHFGPFSGIIVYQVLYFGFLAFGFFMGRRDWAKNKKPILTKIEKMLAGFEE